MNGKNDKQINYYSNVIKHIIYGIAYDVKEEVIRLL